MTRNVASHILYAPFFSYFPSTFNKLLPTKLKFILIAMVKFSLGCLQFDMSAEEPYVLYFTLM
jgi:hypothetical protein